jgi:uncharacterized protein YjbJ (UPF0337 family)
MFMADEKIDQIQGRIEQAAGDLTDNENLQEQGERREQGGKLKEKVNGAIDAVQEKLNKKN